ncbi:hypothetical protein [Marilutibacter chinensis]|uniref:RES domain-containing protein n=1 Tax=Marilutibacter chinensis TaxID=2912247 RepID=A0ABS9HQT1_9GAMM|nr:hypothetical protein [Lysobacter chinensis]MCF7220740.1 hypothetical protein [Lysobacter chinensis]
MTAIREYAKSIHANLAGFLPSQPLGNSSNVGDLYSIGTFNKSNIEKIGSIYNFGGEPQELHSTKKAEQLSLQSATGVKATSKLKGNAPTIPGSSLGVDEAGITVEFQSNTSYLFVAEGLSYKEPVNMPAFLTSARTAIGKVDPRQIGFNSLWLVMRIAEVDRYTLALAKSRAAVFEVGASGSVTALGLSDLASAEASLKLARTHNLQYSVLSSKGSGIFFFAKKVEVGGAIRAYTPVGGYWPPNKSARRASFEDLSGDDVKAFLDAL